MPDDEQVMRIAIRAGMMPSDVEDALRDARDADQMPPTPSEVTEDAMITDATIEASRTWWVFNPAVPNKYKRLLTARESDAK